MRNSRLIYKLTCLFLALGLSCATTSCGGNGAANNDQGMSVTLLGLFSSNDLTGANGGAGGGAGGAGGQSCGQLPTGLSGGYIRLGEISYSAPQASATPTAGNNGTDPAGGYLSVVGLQNNLSGQAFRAERVIIDYFIPGANAQPPSTTVPVFTILGPAEAANQGGVGAGGGAGGAAGGAGGATTNSPANAGLRRPLFTSLPPSFNNLCNRSLTQVTLVPPAIREWLNFNRDLLPETPFKMEVIVKVRGISSSGNVYDTNDGVFDFDVLAENSIDPTITGGTTTTTSEVIQTNEGSVGDLAKLF